jgi:hypothetical protein
MKGRETLCGSAWRRVCAQLWKDLDEYWALEVFHARRGVENKQPTASMWYNLG